MGKYGGVIYIPMLSWVELYGLSDNKRTEIIPRGKWDDNYYSRMYLSNTSREESEVRVGRHVYYS